ncbi:hypothetical protein GCK32_013381, partial [Trichostrongylus colubriformis]
NYFQIYQYQIDVEVLIKKTIKGKSKIIRKRITNRALIRQYFWKCVRQYRDVFGSHFQIVFDDFENAFTRERWKFRDEETFKMGGNTRNETIYVTATEGKLFHFDIASQDVTQRSLSTLLANTIFTQRARYAPADDEIDEREFVEKWLLCRSSIYFITREQQLLSNPELCGPVIAPGVRAWLGAYSSVKTLENSNYALAFGLVNSLFYELDMDLITFYYNVVKQVGLHRGDQQSFEEVLKRSKKLAMNSSQRKDLQSHLKGVRVKTNEAILQRDDRFVLVERHGVFEDVLNYSPSTYQMPDGKLMVEVYHHLGRRLQQALLL